MKKFFIVLGWLFLLGALTSGMLVLDAVKRSNLVLPRTVFGNLSLGGLTRDDAREHIKQALAAYAEKPFTLAARGEAQETSLAELHVAFNERAIMDELKFAGELSNASVLLWSIAGQRVMPKVSADRTELFRVIHEKFPSIPQAKNAYFSNVGKKPVIAAEVHGVTPILEPLLAQLKQDMQFLEHRPLFVEFKDAPPTVSAKDLEANKDALLAAFPKALTLKLEKHTWKADFIKHPEWIAVDRKNYEVGAAESAFTLQWDPLAYSQFLQEVAPTLEQVPEDVRIARDAEGKVTIDGRGNEGKAIPRDRLLTLANISLSKGEAETEIPLDVVPFKVEVSPELKELGIHGLLAVGHTRFTGSPANRQHNIGVGISKFNGLVIAPGETFSFGKNLGEVDGSTGYKKELVIKPEGTIPEYGGGICQVSSTMYRAALFAGLPIAERRAHSYAVSYYSQILGHGLDATVYPPSPDLKFVNDTPGAILVQAYVDGVDAYYKFYGTDDGRKVEMEGPMISNQRGPPAEPVLVPDKNLKPGEKKQVEKAHGGFDVLWYRHLTKANGEKVKEAVVSKYKAVPNKFLVGGEVTPAGENEGLAAAPNPFE